MSHDLLIRGGTVIDGSADAEPRRADVAIDGDRVTAIGSLAGADAAEIVDADGAIVCPGFIDTHVHSEAALLREDERWASLRQGVTTHLGGPDGFGWAGLPRADAEELWRSTLALHGSGPGQEMDGSESPAAWLVRFRDRLPLDLIPTIPHLPVRFDVMHWSTDAAGPAELAAMRTRAEAWLDIGAAALSVGLDYAPSASATAEELVELARMLAPLGRRFVAHSRFRRSGRAAALRETIEIGRRAGVGVVISHQHMDDEFAAILDESDDVDVAFDSHLYPAGCTHLLYNVPEEMQADGTDALLARLSDPAEEVRLARLLDEAMAADHANGAREIIAATGSGRRVGQELVAAAQREGVTPGTFAVQLLLEERADVLLVYQWAPWSGDEAAFAPVAKRSFRHPASLIASDGLYRAGSPHPRGYGTFPHALALVRDHRATTLPAAIHKMSGRPAEVYGLRDRGMLEEGARAHVVVFDPATVAAGATWDEPRLPPRGFGAVIVNGVIAVRDDAPTGRLAGRVSRADA